MRIKKILLKAINRLVLKSKKKVYIVPHNNGGIDKYDLLNYTADNALSIVNYMIDHHLSKNTKFYVECYSEKRMDLIKSTARESGLNIIPILSDRPIEKTKSSTRIRIKNFLLRYSCKTWISCSPFMGFNDIVKGQTFICLSYSTPLKSGISLGHHDLSYMSHYLETSLLTAFIHSAQYRNYVFNCPILGFPRNDNLFSSKKEEAVKRWIENNATPHYKHIVVYAPTYRDYDGAFNGKNVLGFYDKGELEQFLCENEILLIVKYHPLQKIDNVMLSPHILMYEKTYDFTLYDLLSISDMLISDYSSVIHDYIITGKPIVIDCFDFDKYDSSRGFAFEPFDYVCPSPACKTFDELKVNILSEFETEQRSPKYYEVQKMFHKYVDNKATERVWLFLKKYFE